MPEIDKVMIFSEANNVLKCKHSIIAIHPLIVSRARALTHPNHARQHDKAKNNEKCPPWIGEKVTVKKMNVESW